MSNTIRVIADLSVEQTNPDGTKQTYSQDVGNIVTVDAIVATSDEDFVDVVLQNGSVLHGINKKIFSISNGPILPYVEPTPKPVKKRKVSQPSPPPPTEQEVDNGSNDS